MRTIFAHLNDGFLSAKNVLYEPTEAKGCDL